MVRRRGRSRGRRIRVRRKSYRRKAFTAHRNGHVIHEPAARIPATTYYEVDRGEPGHGKRIFKLEKGGLEGWHHTQDADTRHEHLRLVAEKDGWLTVFHRLDALAKVSKKTEPLVSEIARSDANYAREHLGAS